jgi:hypothetical protein
VKSIVSVSIQMVPKWRLTMLCVGGCLSCRSHALPFVLNDATKDVDHKFFEAFTRHLLGSKCKEDDDLDVCW